MTDQQPTELPEPCVGSLDDPASLVAAQLTAVFIAPVPPVLSVRNDQLDAAFAEALAQWVRIVGAVSDDPLRLLSGAALGAWDADLGERGFGKRSFCRRGTFQPNSQRKTLNQTDSGRRISSRGQPFSSPMRCRRSFPRSPWTHSRCFPRSRPTIAASSFALAHVRPGYKQHGYPAFHG